MGLKYYDKLVRDRIPEIIEGKGNDCIVRTLDDAQYRTKLDEKLAEEVAEFSESHLPEELADILEVVYAAAEAWGSSAEEVEQIRIRKQAERGGFARRILLECVRENEQPARKVIPEELLNVQLLADARRTEIIDEEYR